MMKTSDKAVVLGSAAAATGAGTVSLLGMLCCATPLTVSLFGAGRALAITGLAVYQPFLSGIALLLLSYALYRVVKRGGGCAPKLLLGTATVATLASLAASWVLS